MSTIPGGTYDDFLLGTAHGDTLDGGLGDDTILGLGGNDSLFGGDGDDYIDAGAGNDLVDGGAGNDVIAGGVGSEQIRGGAGNDDMNGGAGNDTFLATKNDGDDVYDGGDGIDRLSFASVTGGGVAVDLAGLSASGMTNSNIGDDIVLNIEQVTGTAGADSLSGDDAENLFSGGAGADVIAGLGGNDRLFGDGGADSLTGGSGKDHLTGGADSDTFRFLDAADSGFGPGASDRILDFVSDANVAANETLTADVINLSAIDADGSTGNGNQAFAFIGYANSASPPPAFTNVAGQLRAYTTAPGTTIVEADINGDGTADFRIVLTGAHVMAASDFVL